MRLRIHLDFAGEMQDLADQRFQVFDAAGDFANQLQRILFVGYIFRQQRCVKLNAAQRITNFVRHAGGHFAQRGQTVFAFQLLVLLAQFLTKGKNRLRELIVRLLKLLGDLVVLLDNLPQLIHAARVIRARGSMAGEVVKRRVLHAC